MNSTFAAKVAIVEQRFRELLSTPLLQMRGGTSHVVAGGIYVLYEDGSPVHVGRTRNLRKRLHGHCSERHYHASFAFKRARATTGCYADYRAGNSRKVLSQDTAFRSVFLQNVQSIRAMQYRFLQVTDPL